MRRPPSFHSGKPGLDSVSGFLSKSTTHEKEPELSPKPGVTRFALPCGRKRWALVRNRVGAVLHNRWARPRVHRSSGSVHGLFAVAWTRVRVPWRAPVTNRPLVRARRLAPNTARDSRPWFSSCRASGRSVARLSRPGQLRGARVSARWRFALALFEGEQVVEQ